MSEKLEKEAEEILRSLYPEGEERYMLIKITNYELARKNLTWNKDNGLGFIVTALTTQTPSKFRTDHLKNLKKEVLSKLNEIALVIDSTILRESD